MGRASPDAHSRLSVTIYGVHIEAQRAYGAEPFDATDDLALGGDTSRFDQRIDTHKRPN